MLQFYKPIRPGDFTAQESLMTLALIKTCTSHGEEVAVICIARIDSAVDSSLLSILFKTFDWLDYMVKLFWFIYLFH